MSGELRLLKSSVTPAISADDVIESFGRDKHFARSVYMRRFKSSHITSACALSTECCVADLTEAFILSYSAAIFAVGSSDVNAYML